MIVPSEAASTSPRLGEVVEESSAEFTVHCYNLYEAAPLGALVHPAGHGPVYAVLPSVRPLGSVGSREAGRHDKMAGTHVVTVRRGTTPGIPHYLSKPEVLMRCPSCGQDNLPGNSFCTSCGSPLMEEGSEKKGGWKGLPFYTRVAIAGLLVFVLIYTALNILFMVGGGVEVIGDAVQGAVFYALFMIPTVVVVVLAWRKPDLTLVAAIWAILMLLISAPFIPNALGTFNSFFDAGLMIPSIVSLIMAGVAGIVAFVQHRRGSTRDVSTAGERWVLWATTAIVVGLMVVSGTLHLTSLESVSPDEKAAAISVDMKNSAFTPAQLTVPAGEPAKFVIKNRDLTVHTFTIEELGIDVKVLPGSEKLIELSSPPAGTYVYECTLGIPPSQILHTPAKEDNFTPTDRGTLVVSGP